MRNYENADEYKPSQKPESSPVITQEPLKSSFYFTEHFQLLNPWKPYDLSSANQNVIYIKTASLSSKNFSEKVMVLLSRSYFWHDLINKVSLPQRLNIAYRVYIFAKPIFYVDK